MVHNIAIIGSGPAGLTAALYAGRSSLKPLVIEGNMPGGQLTTTTDVENWPGEVSIKGPEVMKKLRDHAAYYGAQFLGDLVVRVDFSQKPYKLYTENGEEIKAHSVIIASGASHKKLKVPGELEYWGKGVTTCATCDGPFYRNQEVVIAGGGNTAITEASFLSRFASKITLVQILPELSANDPLKHKVLEDPKVSILYNSKIVEIKGNSYGMLDSLIIENHITKEVMHLKAAGLFIAIGFKPNTDMFQEQLEMDEFGYLKLTDTTKTSKEGIFAAGDVSDYRYMQAITSAGFGCMAALDCEQYLRKLGS